jgi:hypothetical protein
MSNTSFYLKSDPSISGGDINLYKPWEFSIFPFFGRAISVFDIKVDTINKFVNFQNIIRYDFSNNLIQINKDFNINNPYGSTSWTESHTFGNPAQKPSVYSHNLYKSVIDDIVTKSPDLSNPALYLMYGPRDDKTIVTEITDNGGYYTFKSSIGYINFDKNTGFPISSLDKPFNYIVYKYDGYSDINRETYNDIMINVPDGEVSYTTYLNNSDLYIIHTTRKSEMKVHKTFKNFEYTETFNNITEKVFYKLLIFAQTPDRTSDEGVSFREQNGVITPHCCVNHRPITPNPYWHGCIYNQGNINNRIIPCSYRIYRKNTFINFQPTNPFPIPTIGEIQYITREIKYQRTNPTVDKFIITIPKTKPTNRIFVYQSGTNKLVHITDYIPKGTIQNVTINYSQGGITSSVTPEYPLPVPQFRLDGNESPFAGWERGGVPYTDKCKQGSIVYNIQGFTSDTPIESMYFNCRDPYTKEVSDGGAWRGDWVNSKFDITKESGYNGLYVNAYHESNVDQIKFYGADGNTRTVGIPGNGTREIYDYICPNGKIAGFFRRAGGNLDGLTAYCASPTIHKDTSTAISWSKNPKNPIEGGKEGNITTYVCRANHNGYWVPGKFHSDTCYYAYGYPGGNNTKTNYELASSNEPLVWKGKNQVSADKKIEAGINETDGAISYICRGVHNNMWVSGKEVNNRCYIEYGGFSISGDEYELLSRQ